MIDKRCQFLPIFNAFCLLPRQQTEGEDQCQRRCGNKA
jgi:hypothetical protein